MRRAVDLDETQKRENVQRGHFSFRINGFFFAIFLLFSILIVRLAILQFVEGKQLVAKENETTSKPTAIAPIRGNIYDVNGYPIAFTKSVQSLYFRIEEGQKKDDVVALAKRLADIFKTYGDPKEKQMTAEEIIEAMDVGYDINKKEGRVVNYNYVPRRIKTPLSDKEIAYILEHRDELRWLEVTEESIREYSKEPTIAAQLVGYLRPFSTARSPQGLSFYKDKNNTDGYLDSEYVGFDGIEQMYQTDLRGVNGTKSYPVNALNQIIGRVTVTPPEKGNNLYLTINKDVQLTAQQAIADQISWLHSPEALRNPYANRGANARAGYAVAMEVNTGRVVAMASYPDYDPNVWINGFSGDDWKNSLQYRVNNGAITTAYPDYPAEELKKHPNSLVFMGSTIKPLSVLVGLNEGLFGIGETYYDSGVFSFGKEGKQSSISNSDRTAYGTLNAATAIEHSSNTFMSAMIGNRLYFNKQNGMDILASYLNKFGIGVPTGSGLPRENGDKSQLEFYVNSKRDSAQSALIYAAWGQNEKATTLQLAQYAATLANKGKRVKPIFVDKITSYEGQVIKKPETEVLDDTKFPDQYWNAVYAGMSKVHVEGFDGFPYPDFARKTGTSTQSVGGKDVDNAVFIAFAPLQNPRLAVAVVVPEGGYGAWGAAPIARKIFDAYDQVIGLDGVPKGAPAAAGTNVPATPAGATAP